MRFENRVVIVGGGATGHGKTIASRFCREGAQVVISGHDGEPVDEVVARLHEQGGEVVGYTGDVSEEVQARDCVGSAIECFGRVDVLINHVIPSDASVPVAEFSVDTFERILGSTIRSAFHMTRAVLPALRKTRGCILLAGSEAGWSGEPNGAPYGGTMGFIQAFIKGVAAEQAAHGIRANCVSASSRMRTHNGNGFFGGEEASSAAANEAEEVADAYAFLASDEARHLTGLLWIVDGGMTWSYREPGDRLPAPLTIPTRPAFEPQLHAR